MNLLLEVTDHLVDRCVVIIDVFDYSLLELADELLSFDSFQSSANDEIAYLVGHEKRKHTPACYFCQCDIEIDCMLISIMNQYSKNTI